MKRKSNTNVTREIQEKNDLSEIRQLLFSLLNYKLLSFRDGREFLGVDAKGGQVLDPQDISRKLLEVNARYLKDFKREDGITYLALIGRIARPALENALKDFDKGHGKTGNRVKDFSRQIEIARTVKYLLDRGFSPMKAYENTAEALKISVSSVRSAWGVRRQR